MTRPITVGILGDYDMARPAHRATDLALLHAAAGLSLELDSQWLPTAALLRPGAAAWLERTDALWAAPGSPYRSLEGALAGIRFARERDRPFLAT